MSKRAEEYSQKAYPLGFSGDEILPWRMGLKEGYEQAEKEILDDAKQVVASFEQAFKQAEKDIIERVIEWVKRNGHLYVNRVKEGDEYVGEFMEEPFVENLRKAMEDKK